VSSTSQGHHTLVTVAFHSHYYHIICVYVRSASARPSPSGDESGLCLTHVVGLGLTISECSFCYNFWGSGWHPLCSGHIHPFSCSNQLSFLQCHHLHPSTNLSVHPRHAFYLCLPCYNNFLSQPVISRVWESFFFIGAILLFELPPTSSSRLQSVHCPLPVFEGPPCRFTCAPPLFIPHPP